jgi:hypothetical protein
VLKPEDQMTYVTGWLAGFKAAGAEPEANWPAAMDAALKDYESARRAATQADEGTGF